MAIKVSPFVFGLLALMLCASDGYAQDPSAELLFGSSTTAEIDCEAVFQQQRLHDLKELLASSLASPAEVNHVEHALKLVSRQRLAVSNAKAATPVEIRVTGEQPHRPNAVIVLPGFEAGHAGREVVITGDLPTANEVIDERQAERNAIAHKEQFWQELHSRLERINDGSVSIQNELRAADHQLQMASLRQAALKPVALLAFRRQSESDANRSPNDVRETIEYEEAQRDEILGWLRNRESQLVDRMARVAELQRIVYIDPSFGEELKREQLLERVAQAEVAMVEEQLTETELRLEYLRRVSKSAGNKKMLQAALALFESRQNQQASIAFAQAQVKYLEWKMAAIDDLFETDAATWKEWRLASMELATMQEKVRALQSQREHSAKIARWLTQLIEHIAPTTTETDLVGVSDQGE